MAWTWRLSSSGTGEPQLKQCAETLATLLAAEPPAADKLVSTLQELPLSTTPEQVVNYRLPRQSSRTAVHLAASKGLWQCLEVLLKHGGDPNALSSQRDMRQTPLHLAARQGSGKSIEVLLEYGANYQLENDRKQTALRLTTDDTCRMSFENAIARLEVPKRSRGEEDIVKELHRIAENKESHTFFQLYTNQSAEKVDLGKRWNDKRVEPDGTVTLLYSACASEAEDIVANILSRSANQPLPNLKTGDSPLHVVSEKGNANIVRRLLQHSPKLLLEQNSEQRSALHSACAKGYQGVVEIILEHVCQLVRNSPDAYNEENTFSLDFRDSEEVTPFYLACLHGHAGIVRQILSLKTNLGNAVSLTVNAAQKNGHTALHAAAYSGSSEVVDLLLSLEEVEVDVLVPPIMETKNLLWQAIGGSPYERLANVSLKIFVSATGKFITDSNGLMKGDQPLCISPLAEACAHNHADAVEVFLKHGVRDEQGVACRVLVAMGRFDLCRKVLAYHCKLSKNKTKNGTKSYPEDMWSLRLLWDGKKLPVVRREWLGSNSVFCPSIQGDEYDNAGDSRQEQQNRASPTTSLSLHLPQRVDHYLIQSVTLKSNCLKYVPLELFQLPNVTSINLSENQLVMLPGDRLKEGQGVCGWECRRLQYLKISGNCLTELPLSLWLLPELRTIDAVRNKLTTLVSKKVWSIVNLGKCIEKVDVSCNDLTKIDPFLADLQSLKSLFFSHNRLTTIPLVLWGLESLNELNVSNNCITTLSSSPVDREPDVPEEFHENVEEMDSHHPAMTGATRVTGAQINFRPQMSHYPSLDPQQSIDGGLMSMGIDRVDFTEGKNETMEGLNEYSTSNLQKLDLSHNKLKEFPRELPCVAPSLLELNVSNNPGLGEVELRFLPPTLKKFTARNCQIERFGSVLNKMQLKAIKLLCARKELDDMSCQHRNHRRLPNLSTLDLRQNSLTHFQVLFHTPLNTGTPNFGAEEDVYRRQVAAKDLLYPSLENLNLSHNCLQGQFNPNIAHLTSIKAIQLNDNKQLQIIPYEFGHFKRFKGFTELNIMNLPELVQPPKDVQGHMCQQLLTYLAAGLRESEMYRSIKLFLVGKGLRGKSTLLRRLCNLADQKTERTVGIEIVNFSYVPHTRSVIFGRSKHGKEPVKFLVWDFAGQDQYHSTHHCFYSRRSLYLAVYRLTDGEEGVRELDTWLRNIQLRARGCPVVIVGTHMDRVDKQHIAHLEDFARKLYIECDPRDPNFPQVVDVVSVSCMKLHLRDNNVEKLKKTLYEIATHLQLARDGQTLKYVPDMEEDNAKALFRQQVPKSFLTLQQKCLDYAEQCQDWVEPAVGGAVHQLCNGAGPHNGEGQHNGAGLHNGAGRDCEEVLVPVMNEEEFRNRFSGLFDDKEELDEAVAFLHLQGTLLHFDDHSLRDLYFLDPQWLAKLMAHVIHPQAIQGDSAVIHGVVQVSHLFWNHSFSDCLKQKYIQLLEKFEVALKISPSQVLIPSLMPDTVTYPQPNDDLRDILQFADEYYLPALRRFWLADFIPEGFWPRVICRIANDQQIDKILRTLIGKDVTAITPTNPIANSADEEAAGKESLVGWCPWKMGIVFSHRGRTLLVVKEENNVAPETNDDLEWLPAKKRIEIHVYVQEWFEVQSELELAGHSATMLQNTFSLPGIATQLLVKISQHILSLAHDWFRGMLQNELIYIPCWKCYGQMVPNVDEEECKAVCKRQSRYFPVSRRDETFPVFAFNHEKCIVIAARDQDLRCPIHGPIKVVHTAPDLIFWDLASLSAYQQDMSSPLEIKDNEALGKGGFGFVCKGELILKEGKRKKVAVKGFLSESSEIEHCSMAELLEISKQDKNLYHGYKEIRQEVSFLAVLDHPNLTKLCGVRTSPYMCLLLELAPHGSLQHMLKVYKKCEVVLEPMTLKTSIYQIASGMEYLHMHQIVHKDMKSANVLVWHFPSGRLPKEKRVEQAGNVLLKLADYGISQVFTKPIMKLVHDPMGTPGFMAPELFGILGQEIATEKVDVFAFGMVVYELLSLQAPFANVEPPKRNNLVKDNKRPPLQGRGLWSPVMAQSIMRMCWSHDPDDRPTMKEVTQWVQREEFTRLRAEIFLDKVESVSCACVSRITLEDEQEDEEVCITTNGHDASGIGHIPVENSITSAVFEGFNTSTIMGDMDPCTQYTRLQYAPLSFTAESGILPPIQNRLVSDTSVGDSVDGEIKHKERSRYVKHLRKQTYSQVWVCDRKEKGLLEIFTYCDSQAGYYAFAAGSSDQITTICPVHNMMWIGTTKGILKLKHAPTLTTKFKGELKAEDRSLDKTYVLNITHVKQESSVLVSTDANEIWAFNDKLTPEGLIVQERMSLSQDTNCYQMAVVEVMGSLEVWGTMDNSQLIMLKRQGRGWTMERPYRIDCKQNWQFYHIAHAAFEDEGGVPHNHLWVPYWKKSLMVCWDLQKRQCRTTLGTTALKHDSRDSAHPKVTALLTSGKKVLVGTDVGTVGIIDSETCEVLHCLQWHTQKVRTLLLMPKEMEPCVCSEIPLAECSVENSSGARHTSTRKIVRQRTLSEPDLPSLPDNNPLIVHNADLEKCMVASVGNGRTGMTKTNPSKNHDVCLLLWRC